MRRKEELRRGGGEKDIRAEERGDSTEVQRIEVRREGFQSRGKRIELRSAEQMRVRREEELSRREGEQGRGGGANTEQFLVRVCNRTLYGNICPILPGTNIQVYGTRKKTQISRCKFSKCMQIT